jgi:monomeric sarcosine oxidase
MNNHSTDIIVVGGGVMGCTTAYQLAKDGRTVLLLEQYTIGNRMGSSHGASRLFRLAHTNPDYVELARQAYGLWRELESESGERLMKQVDALDIGTPAILTELRTTLEATGVPFVALDRDEIMHRFPQFSLPEDVTGLYQADYAMLAADRCVSAFAALARGHGATIVEGETVQQVRPTSSGVEVRTDKGTYSARGVVLCAGSWMKPLMRQLGIDLPLTIRKEHLTYYMPGDPENWLPGRFPIFRHHLSGVNGRWGVGFPIFEHPGVKMLVDCTGPFVEPDDPDRSVDQAVVSRVREYVAGILPGLGENIIGAETCRYTMTPDDVFILDHHPAHPQVVVASPCSGHGFKFAPLIGRILADLVVRGRTEYNIERFRLDRPGLR